MKTRFLLISALLVSCAFAQTAATSPNSPITAPPGTIEKAPVGPQTPDTLTAVSKERDELKAQLGQTQVASQYYQVLADRNALAVQLLQAQQQNAKLEGELTAARAEIVALKTPAKPAASAGK